MLHGGVGVEIGEQRLLVVVEFVGQSAVVEIVTNGGDEHGHRLQQRETVPQSLQNRVPFLPKVFIVFFFFCGGAGGEAEDA